MRPRRNRLIVGVLVVAAVALSIILAGQLGLPAYAAWIAGWSMATVGAYWIDKRQARRGGWRIPESGLHGLAIGGGAIGGWIGMLGFRHKNRRPAFATVLFLATLAQVGVGLWLLRGGT